MWNWMFRSRSIGTALLATVNTALAAVIMLLLSWHYAARLDTAIDVRRAGLHAEARAIHHGVLHQLQTHGGCSAARFAQQIASQSGRGETQEQRVEVAFSANTSDVAANRQSTDTGQDWIVGRFTSNGIQVFVSERLVEIRQVARRELFVQIGLLGLLGLLATVLVNVVLTRIVNVPLAHLKGALRRIGNGDFQTRIAPSGSLEMQALGRIVNGMSAQLAQSTAQRESQMRRARRIQQHLLPRQPEIPGVAVSCLFLPAEEVGGDFYDLFRLRDGRWVVCIADVTGHGIPAAMGAAMLKCLLQAAAEDAEGSPAQMLRQINRHFARVAAPDDFASVFLACWTPWSGTVTYASAGHEPALLLPRTGDARWLRSTGLLLGIDDQAEWEERAFPVSTNDRLLLYSDGATEVHGEAGELFGRERLKCCFAAARDHRPDIAIDGLRLAIDEYRGEQPQSDDLTLLAMTFDGDVAKAESVPFGHAPASNGVSRT